MHDGYDVSSDELVVRLSKAEAQAVRVVLYNQVSAHNLCPGYLVFDAMKKLDALIEKPAGSASAGEKS